MQLSSFVGRKREAAEVKRLLSASRLVTLTGAGGCGKTRLALEVARTTLADYPDGVWSVQLASLSDATLVPQAAATVFNVREVEGRPILALLQSYLRNRRLLLVLDNCEHLVEATAQLAEALLTHCPQLQILATSREALAIAGEYAWLVPSLSLPPPGEPRLVETLMDSDAVRLFVERAATTLPTFSLTEENAPAVEQVYRRLDGIPLAIELAAARVKLLRVEEIAARLDDRFRLLAGGSRTALPRHQTLAALVDWSYGLLAPAEQRLLRWLSVFAGGFTLDAVEAVCTETDEGAVLELLAQLVNKSLVIAEREPGQEARYHLLETIRQYASVKLEKVGEAGPARDCLLDFFLHLAEAAEPKLQSGEQLVWLDLLEVEHDNLRAALAWSLEDAAGDRQSGVRLATALVPFWIIHSHLLEGRRWLDLALEIRHNTALPVQARLLCNAGRLWVEQWKDDSTSLLHESLDLYRRLEDVCGIAASLCWLGWCDIRFGRDPGKAVPRWEKGLKLASKAGDRRLLISLYHGLAWIAMEKGDSGQTEELSARGLDLARETGDRQMQLRMLFILGRNAAQQGDYRRATNILQETLALAREIGNGRDEAAVLNWLGEAARGQRAFEQATAFYDGALALRQRQNSSTGIAINYHCLGLVAAAQGEWLRAESLFQQSMALNQEETEPVVWLLNTWGLARVALAKGQTRLAGQLFAVVEPLTHDFTYGILADDQDEYRREVAQARGHLGEDAFAAAWAEGLALSLEEAVALALAETARSP